VSDCGIDKTYISLLRLTVFCGIRCICEVLT